MGARRGRAGTGLLVVALAFVGCGEGESAGDVAPDDSAETVAPDESAGDVAPDDSARDVAPDMAGDMATDAVVEELFGAVANGDNETWRALHATDATVSFGNASPVPLFGPFDGVEDDFDGDGVASLADDLQSRHALHGPAGQRMGWDCAPNGERQVECLVESTDAMIELGGGGTLAMRTRYTIENGKIAHFEILGPVDPVQASAVDAAFARALSSYELWVRRQHPDRYSDAFREPCCRGAMIRTAEAIALHSELIAEFLAAS